MAANVLSVKCPGTCGGACRGQWVEVRGYGTKAKTVRVDPCSSLLAQGWTGPQMAVYQANAAQMLGL